MSPFVAPTLAWLATIAAALGLAAVTPNGRAVIGQLPELRGTNLERQTVHLPGALRTERTVAFIALRQGHGPQLDAWQRELALRPGPEVDWVRLAVLDESSAPRRGTLEERLQQRYAGRDERARVVSVLVNSPAFMQALGLADPRDPVVLVLNRQGEILARETGSVDAGKRDHILSMLHALEL